MIRCSRHARLRFEDEPGPLIEGAEDLVDQLGCRSQGLGRLDVVAFGFSESSLEPGERASRGRGVRRHGSLAELAEFPLGKKATRFPHLGGEGVRGKTRETRQGGAAACQLPELRRARFRQAKVRLAGRTNPDKEPGSGLRKEGAGGQQTKEQGG